MIQDWLSPEFFELGAFVTDEKREYVFLGKGGEIVSADTFTRTEGPQFVLKNFFDDRYRIYRPASFLKVPFSEVPTLAATKKLFRSLGNEDDLYREDFLRLTTSFGESLAKVVLVSRETYTREKDLVPHLFHRAIAFETGMAYGFWDRNGGIIGCTPETLFRIEDKKLSTVALAGTAKLGEEKKLLSSMKDLREHRLVIDDIREKLKDLGPVWVSETRTQAFKNLIHFRTDIEAPYSGEALAPLLERFTPTAALGGYPKANALAFLRETLYARKFPERIFGSALGLLTEEHTQFLVMIRNVQWNKDEVFIESGGGVVPESELMAEMEEIRMKRRTVEAHYLC